MDRLFRTVTVLFVVATLVGCGAAAPAAAPAATAPAAAPAASVLHVGGPADSYRADPADLGRYNLGMFPVNANIFDQLTLMDSSFAVKPMLAESWEYLPDTKTWRFKLRKDVKFHNGTPFTAAAVVETMKRHAKGPGANQLRIDENSTKAVDDYTVDITPTAPNFALPAQLVHPQFGIHAPGVDLTKQQIGTGPFTMGEYRKGERLVVARNPNYWGSKALIERIEFRFFPDPQARILALQAGEVDVIYDVAPESAKALQDAGKLKVIAADVSAAQYLMVMLTGAAPYTLGRDAAIRQALGYAINHEELVATAFDGFAANAQTFAPAAVLGQNAAKITGFSYDPEQAKTLLEQAGWKDADGDGIREKDGKPLRLELVNGFPSAAENSSTAEVLQAQARAVGIDLQIVATPDNPAYDERLKQKQGDLFLEIGNQNSATPCFLLSLYYGRAPKPGNYQVAFAPALIGVNAYDDAVDACNGTPNLDEARAAAAEAIRVSVDEAHVNIPLVGIKRIWAVSPQVQNFNPHPVRLHVRWEGVSVTH